MTKEFKPRVLLVEDDPNLGNLLLEYLQAKEYDTTLATNGKEGLTQFKNNVFDVCIFDVMMPVMDGYTLAREVRKLDAETPIVFLTAKSMKEDTIEGFNAGGDDYLTKPFSMEELLLRLKAILRRTKNQTLTNSDQNNFEVGDYKFDFNLQKLEVGGKAQKLTTREAELLKLLCINVNDVLDRTFALKSIWHDDNYFNGRSMDVYIAKLRKYLREDPNLEIVNVHGKGFKLLVKNTL
jgi:DNA-binding response OmpR family regulator